MDFSWNSLLPATFQAKLAIGLCRSEGGEPVRGGGIHWWWPNRRRSDIEIYTATVLFHRLFQNPLLLAIILTKLMPWVSVGQWCAFGATLVRWWLAGIWPDFDQNMSNWTFFYQKFSIRPLLAEIDIGHVLGFVREEVFWTSLASVVAVGVGIGKPLLFAHCHQIFRIWWFFFSSSISFREIMIMSFRFDLC